MIVYVIIFIEETAFRDTPVNRRTLKRKLLRMRAVLKWLGRATMSRKGRNALSVSSTKVYFDIAVDELPAGRIVFKVR